MIVELALAAALHVMPSNPVDPNQVGICLALHGANEATATPAVFRMCEDTAVALAAAQTLPPWHPVAAPVTGAKTAPKASRSVSTTTGPSGTSETVTTVSGGVTTRVTTRHGVKGTTTTRTITTKG